MTVTATCSVDEVIATAIAQIGVHEDPAGSNKQPYGAWFGMNGVAWCAIFVSWVLHHAGWGTFAITSSNGFSYCPDGVAFFKRNRAWAAPTVTPKRGWVVFFDFPGDGINRPSHTGIVEGVLADGRVATIEGNTNPAGGRTGGEVMRHNRAASGGIIGYGIVTYPNTLLNHDDLSEEDDMGIALVPRADKNGYDIYAHTGWTQARLVADAGEIPELLRANGLPANTDLPALAHAGTDRRVILAGQYAMDRVPKVHP